jgi:hypothetical protein
MTTVPNSRVKSRKKLEKPQEFSGSLGLFVLLKTTNEFQQLRMKLV